MGKRPKVPAALHSELSEYSSLLRALRTSNTLDLAAQLTPHVSAPPSASASVYEDDFEDDSILDDEGESERPLTETVTDPLDGTESSMQDEDAGMRKLKRKAKRKVAKAKAPKDTWTRWPLLAGDVHVPEWSLQDEIKLLATQAMKAEVTDELANQPDESVIPAGQASPDDALPGASSTAISGFVPVDATSDEDDAGEEDPDLLLPPPVLNALTASSGRFLCQVLALLAAYIPSREKSMQNRLHPTNWESVLDVVAVNGLVNDRRVVVPIRAVKYRSDYVLGLRSLFVNVFPPCILVRREVRGTTLS